LCFILYEVVDYFYEYNVVSRTKV